MNVSSTYGSGRSGIHETAVTLVNNNTFLSVSVPAACITHSCRRTATHGRLTRRNADGTRTYRHTPCKRMTCTDCGPLVIAQRMRIITEAIRAHDLTRHIILTLPPSFSGGHKRLKRKLSRFIKRLRKQYGQDLKYLWVLGRGKTYRLHIHLLIDMTLDPEELKDAWVSLTGAYKVIVKTYTTRTAHKGAWYIMKNMVETLGVDVGRRIAYSKSIGLRFEKQRQELKAPSDWSYQPGLSTATAARQVGAPHPLYGADYNPDEVTVTPRGGLPPCGTVSNSAPLSIAGRQDGRRPAGALIKLVLPPSAPGEVAPSGSPLPSLTKEGASHA